MYVATNKRRGKRTREIQIPGGGRLNGGQELEKEERYVYETKRDRREKEKEKRALASLMCRGARDGPSHACTTHSLSLKPHMDEPSNCAARSFRFLFGRPSSISPRVS